MCVKDMMVKTVDLVSAPPWVLNMEFYGHIINLRSELLGTVTIFTIFSKQVLLLLLFVLFVFCFFGVFFATPVGYGSSQARDQIWAVAATYATAAATLDP